MLDVELLARLVEPGVHMQRILVGYIEDIAQLTSVGDVQHSNAVRQAHIQFLKEASRGKRTPFRNKTYSPYT